jgi:hypothetical protein
MQRQKKGSMLTTLDRCPVFHVEYPALPLLG